MPARLHVLTLVPQLPHSSDFFSPGIQSGGGEGMVGFAGAPVVSAGVSPEVLVSSGVLGESVGAGSGSVGSDAGGWALAAESPGPVIFARATPSTASSPTPNAASTECRRHRGVGMCGRIDRISRLM